MSDYKAIRMDKLETVAAAARVLCCFWEDLHDEANVCWDILADALDALDKEASKDKTKPRIESVLRLEVAYLRCVEDAARMVVGAAQAMGAGSSVDNLVGMLEDLDKFRDEEGYWMG